MSAKIAAGVPAIFQLWGGATFSIIESLPLSVLEVELAAL